MFRIRPSTFLLAAGLPLAIVACGQAANNPATPSPMASAAANIQVVSDPATIGVYTPATASVHAGDSVRWTFADINPHSVTADDGKEFDSTPMSSGKTFDHVFARAGTYAYHCSIHPEMHGTITVS